jgi:hypothetical protein
VAPDEKGWGGDRSAVLTASDFRFLLEQYNWEIEGSELVSVDAKGRGVHLFDRATPELSPPGALVVRREPHWYKRSFSVPAESLKQLRRLLHERSFVELGASYAGERAYSSDATTFLLTAAGHSKRVDCSHWYPSGIAQIRAFMRELAQAGEKAASAEALTGLQASILSAELHGERRAGSSIELSTPKERYVSAAPYKLVLVEGYIFLKFTLNNNDREPFGPFHFTSSRHDQLEYESPPGYFRSVRAEARKWWYSYSYLHMSSELVDASELQLLGLLKQTP